MPISIQQKIQNLTEWVEAIRGNNPESKLTTCNILTGYGLANEGEPMPCNIADINAVIANVQEKITELRVQYAEEEVPKMLGTVDTGFAVGFSANTQIPTLTGMSQQIAQIIAATGLRPATVVVDGVNVTANGNNIVLSVPNVDNPVTVAELLSEFADEMEIKVTTTAATEIFDRNVAQAAAYQSTANLQELVLAEFAGNKQVLDAPSLNNTDVVIDGKEVTIDFSAVGSEPIVFHVDWGDGNDMDNAVSPQTHEYADWDTEYTITITATNDAPNGTDTDTFTVRTDEEPIVPPPNTAPELVNINKSVDGRTVTVTWDATGNPAPTFTMDWEDNGNAVAVTSGATHTYPNWDTNYTAVLTATNGTSPDAVENLTVTIGPQPTAPTISSFTVEITTDPEVRATWSAAGFPAPIYDINWGDGVTENGAASGVTHIYEIDDDYTVTLTATNSEGSDSATDTVTIEDSGMS